VTDAEPSRPEPAAPGRATSEPATSDLVGARSILTIPNLVTALRLLCLPVFLYVLFVVENRAAAAWLLGGLGATDWVDGYLARRLGQVSEFGKMFDPTVDRLLFIVGLLGIMIDGSMPIWFGVAVLAREIVVGATMATAKLVFGMERFDVTFLGKTATFLLMFAIPGFLLGSSDMAGAEWFWRVAWLLGVPGLVLSYYTAIAYIPLVRDGVRAGRAQRQAS
jgi:cardiolipin synthase (CMP-forming)